MIGAGGGGHRARLLLSLGVGLAAGLLALLLPHPIVFQGVGVGDIGAPLLGMQRFLDGTAPYGISTDRGPLTAYPFTTSLVLLPFLTLPLWLVAPLFCALSSGLLAYGLLKKGETWRLLLFLSVPFLSSVHSVQWTLLFAAALLLPPLLPLAVAKPQLGLVLLAAGRWERRWAIIAMLLLLLSLALYPMWPLDWWREGMLAAYTGRVPLSVGVGPLLLLAALCWPARRARLLLAMAFVPQRIWYDQLLLFLLPRSWQGLLGLVAGSWLAVAVTPDAGWLATTGEQAPHAWRAVVLFVYLPALALLLWEERERLQRRWRGWQMPNRGEP